MDLMIDFIKMLNDTFMRHDSSNDKDVSDLRDMGFYEEGDEEVVI